MTIYRSANIPEAYAKVEQIVVSTVGNGIRYIRDRITVAMNTVVSMENGNKRSIVVSKLGCSMQLLTGEVCYLFFRHGSTRNHLGLNSGYL